MLLQTNSYVVPREKRAEHARLVRKFRQTLARLGCDQFDVFEQVGPNWGGGETTGRFVQMMRFRDRKHQVAVQAAEKQDPAAQALIQEFVELINFGYQQQQGLFAVGYYQSVLPVAPMRMLPVEGDENLPAEAESEQPHGWGADQPMTADVDMGLGNDDTAAVGGIDDDKDTRAGQGAPFDAEAEAAAALHGVGDDSKLGPDDLELEVDFSDVTDAAGADPQPPPPRSPRPPQS